MGPKIRLRVITFVFLKILSLNTWTNTIDHLIDRVFPNLNRNACSTQYMHECGIPCTRNDYVDEINARMINIFLGKTTVFYSFDSLDDDERNNYP
jgi:hypothetical protein